MVNKKNDNHKFNDNLQLIAKSSFVVLLTVFLSKILTYVYRIIIARQFNAEIYGVFSLSWGIVAFFKIFANVGLDGGLLRFVSFYRGKEKKDIISYLIKTTLSIVSILSIFIGFMLFLLSDFIALEIFKSQELGFFLKILSFAIPLGTLGGVFLSIIRAYENIFWTNFTTKILENFMRLDTLVLLILFGLNSNSIALSYFFGSLSVFLVARSIFKSLTRKDLEHYRNDGVDKKECRKAFREMVSYSIPIIFFGFTFNILSSTDSFIIGFFGTVEDVGFYSAALPIASLLLLSKDLFTSIFFPIITREYAKGEIEIVGQLTRQVSKWILIISLPFLTLLLIFPEFFILLFFGKAYVVAENALRFLAFGVFFNTIFGICTEVIYMTGRSKTVLIDIVLVSLLNIALNLMLVPKYGISGAGFATMISTILLHLIYMFQVKKFTSINLFKKNTMRVLAVVIALAAILLLIKQMILISFIMFIFVAGLFLLIYSFLIFRLGLFDDSDLLLLKKLKSKLTNSLPAKNNGEESLRA